MLLLNNPASGARTIIAIFRWLTLRDGAFGRKRYNDRGTSTSDHITQMFLPELRGRVPGVEYEELSHDCGHFDGLRSTRDGTGLRQRR